MWLFAGVYGLWLVLFAVPPERRLRAAAILVGLGVVVVAAWLIPEQIGSGRLLRAASRALEPVAGSPATASVPFVATFTNAAPALPWPLYAAGVFYVASALRGADRRPQRALVLALAVIATALMVIVALMAEMGFTGNSRYLTIPIALTGILGGAGLVRIASLARSGLAPRGAAAAVGARVGGRREGGARLRTGLRRVVRRPDRGGGARRPDVPGEHRPRRARHGRRAPQRDDRRPAPVPCPAADRQVGVRHVVPAIAAGAAR